MKLREATDEEKKQIQEYKDDEFITENYYFVVIEDYISDCPAYCGKAKIVKKWTFDEFFKSEGDENER